jgi:hypothetical protein
VARAKGSDSKPPAAPDDPGGELEARTSIPTPRKWPPCQRLAEAAAADEPRHPAAEPPRADGRTHRTRPRRDDPPLYQHRTVWLVCALALAIALFVRFECR